MQCPKAENLMLLTLVVVSCGWVRGEEFRFSARHDHLIGKCEGTLTISETGLRYDTPKKGHSVDLPYEDIQQFGLSARKITLLTYADRSLYFGRDERLNFELKDAQATDRLRLFLEARLTRPLVSSIVPDPEEGAITIPVKYRDWPQGAEGILELGTDAVVFRSREPDRSRIWRYSELVSIGSTGPYQLRLTAMERTGGEFGAGKDFVFDLKTKLPTEAYDRIWAKVHRPRIDTP